MLLDNQGRVIQPGAEILPRIVAVPCRVQQVSAVLQPGLTLLDAVAQALPGCAGAALRLHGGAFGPMHYVWPDYARTSEHAAFYSSLFSPEGETTLEDACLTFGTRDEMPWLHCHGFWTNADGTRTGGHVMPDQAVVSSPIPVTAWMLDGATFATKLDTEVNFNLLGPVTAPQSGLGNSAAVALRLRPGLDFADTLCHIVAAQGWQAARIAGGVGSLVGLLLEHGPGFSPRPTEMFITNSHITPERALLDVAMIDHEGTRISGRLGSGNKVLMTMELVLFAQS